MSSVSRAADFGHRDYVDYDERQRRRRIAKCFIEYDRQLRSQEMAYSTHSSVMTPRTASPKNDVLAGWPTSWDLKVEVDQVTLPNLDQLEHFLFTPSQFLC